MKTATRKAKREQKYISRAAFEEKYLENTAYKYEWKNGRVAQESYITPNERYIINNIITKFNLTNDYQQGNSIMGEADCYFSAIKSYRRPDAAHFTQNQIHHPEEAEEAPALVIEVSSPSNSDEHNKEKILDYLAAGVQMVWYIYPQIKQVWIHTGPKEIMVCDQHDVCDADSVVPGFKVKVEDIFERKALTVKG